ncbi:hypothetical protein NDU88_002197 [Pleurodeles waltl]|uniref:Uncharacterized protein n=1 Tax=Pleurodeles waltl TaxID=8319 RepID=A0AAV7WKK0_PLEWA|nr:hypothetical protein NDU88_002197 [Pleurodeles waltl]
MGQRCLEQRCPVQRCLERRCPVQWCLERRGPVQPCLERPGPVQRCLELQCPVQLFFTIAPSSLQWSSAAPVIRIAVALPGRFPPPGP